MTKHTVLQVCLSSSWGGLEMVTYETALLLQSRGINCWNLAQAKSPLAKKLRQAHLQVIEIKPGRLRLFRNIFITRFLIMKYQISTIWVQRLHDLFIPELALIGKNPTPIVGFAHTFLNVYKRDLYHFLVYKKLSSLIALTPSQKKNLTEYIAIEKEKIQVIPNSVDTQKFHPSKRSLQLRKELDPSGTRTLIGLIGRIDKAKGQSLLLDAAKILWDKNIRNFSLVFVGEETLNEPGILDSLQKKAKELNLENHSIFTGYRSDIPEIMASLDIVVMASDAETFGRVIIEAMAAGTVVVASNAGGVADIINNHKEGLTFKTKDPTSLASSLQQLVQNPQLRDQLAYQALSKVRETYSQDVIQEKLLRLLEN